MANAVFGATFDTYVQSQISIRQSNILGNITGFSSEVLANSKEKIASFGINSQLIYAQQTAYTRLISGINDDKGNTTALKYQLFGTNFGDENNKLNFTKGLANDWNSLASYGFVSDERYGFVPPPGITSIDVKALNRGSLREANIEILCHSIDQFNIIDRLYLRLGYTVCIDWGWTTYIGNDGTIIQADLTNNWANEVLKGSDDGYDTIQNKIQEYRKKSSGNWDAMIGRVVNFSWTVERNGGFNIRLTIRSVGDVIESLKANTSHPVKSTSEEIINGETDEQPPLEYNKTKSSLNRILWYLANLFKNDSTPTIKSQDSTSPTAISAGTGLTPNKNYPAEPSKMDLAYFPFPSLEGVEKTIGENKIKYQYYLRLGSLLRLVSDFLLLYNTEKDNKPELFKINYDRDKNFMFTYPRHCGLDPRICLIPINQEIQAIPGEEQNDPTKTSSTAELSYEEVTFTWNTYLDLGISGIDKPQKGPWSADPFGSDTKAYGYVTINGEFNNVCRVFGDGGDDQDETLINRLNRYKNLNDRKPIEYGFPSYDFIPDPLDAQEKAGIIAPTRVEFLPAVNKEIKTDSWTGGTSATYYKYDKYTSEDLFKFIDENRSNYFEFVGQKYRGFFGGDQPGYLLAISEQNGNATNIDLNDVNNLGKYFLVQDGKYDHVKKELISFRGEVNNVSKVYQVMVLQHQAKFIRWFKPTTVLAGTTQLPTEENIVDVNNELYKDYINDTNSQFRVADHNFAGRTMEIMVNMNYIAKTLESYIDTTTGATSVYDFLNKLMEGIQNSLGNINRFNITYNEDKNEFKIVDSTFIPGIADICKDCGANYNKNNSKFNLKSKYNSPTYGSFIRDFSIKTKLSNNFASMVTIGAQANGNVVGEDATALSKWNVGLTDRFYPSKSSANEPETSDVNSSYTSNILTLTILNDRVNDGNITNEQIDGANNPSTDLYKYELGKYVEVGDIPSIGFIPIDLELTMDGLSGMKIYEMFNVDDSYLPSSYKDSIQFISTGISHKIQDGDWITTINSICGPNFDPYKTGKFSGNLKRPNIKYAKPVKKVIVEKSPSPSGGPGGTTGWLDPVTEGKCTPEYSLVDQSLSKPTKYTDQNVGTGAGLKMNNIKSKNQKYLYQDYLPALKEYEKKNGSLPKGLKVIILAQAIQEGYYPGARAYTTKNPGNIGNTDSGNNKDMGGIVGGITAQIEYIKEAAYGKGNGKWSKNNYKFGPINRINQYSGELKTCVPGFKADYQGALGHYLVLYATGPRLGSPYSYPNSYLNNILGFLEYNGITGVTYQTKLIDIITRN